MQTTCFVRESVSLRDRAETVEQSLFLSRGTG
jgi:hypothetical protein